MSRRERPEDGLPDARDGLTRKERLVLLTLQALQRERATDRFDPADVSVPMTQLYGRVMEKIDMSVAELQAIVGRLTGHAIPSSRPPSPSRPPRLARMLVPSPLGDLVVGLTRENTVAALDFAEREPREWAGAPETTSPGVAAALTAYFAGDLAALDTLVVEPHGTPFQVAVWRALRTIPAGTTCTYAELAARLGQPVGASRAVGAANGANPIAIVVPCHRVVAAGGKLGGYSGGLDRKRWLLDHEQRHAPFRLA